MEQTKALVLTCSDAASRGERIDQSGPAVAEVLRTAGYEVLGIRVIADDEAAIADAIVSATDRQGVRLVVTTGGTGIAPRDVTPEATMSVAAKRVDGFGELMRASSLKNTRMAALSRAGAAVRGSSLIINVPGSVAGATENLNAVIDLIPHALELLGGERVEQHPTKK